jgi:hypothetical protein
MIEPLLATIAGLGSECRNAPPFGIESVWRKASCSGRERYPLVAGCSLSSRVGCGNGCSESAVTAELRDSEVSMELIAVASPSVIQPAKDACVADTRTDPRTSATRPNRPGMRIRQ